MTTRWLSKRAKGSREADEAARAIKRLTDPARMEAIEKAEAVRKAAVKEKSLRLKIEQDLRLGRSLEGMNIKGALFYYREIVKLAKGL